MIGNDCAVAVLAGGQSSRFSGRDKQEILFGGTAMGRRAATNALSICREVIIVGKNPGPYRDLPVRLVSDAIPGFGPLSGLHAALASSSREWIYLIACDMPVFSEDWFARIMQIAEANPGAEAIAARRGNYMEPFHALYSKRFQSRLESAFARARESGRRLSFASALENTDSIFVPEREVRVYSRDWSLFSSINSPEDLDRAMKCLGVESPIPSGKLPQ